METYPSPGTSAYTHIQRAGPFTPARGGATSHGRQRSTRNPRCSAARDSGTRGLAPTARRRSPPETPRAARPEVTRSHVALRATAHAQGSTRSTQRTASGGSAQVTERTCYGAIFRNTIPRPHQKNPSRIHTENRNTRRRVQIAATHTDATLIEITGHSCHCNHAGIRWRTMSSPSLDRCTPSDTKYFLESSPTRCQRL